MTTKTQASTRKRAISCREKKKHTETAAYMAAKKMNDKGKYVKPYQCSICKGWHLAHRNKEAVLQDLFARIEAERSKGSKTGIRTV